MPWSWPIYYSKVAQILKIPHTERFRNLPGYLFATLGFYFDLGPRLSLCSYCLRNCLLWCAIGYCFSILSYFACLQLYPGKVFTVTPNKATSRYSRKLFFFSWVKSVTYKRETALYNECCHFCSSLMPWAALSDRMIGFRFVKSMKLSVLDRPK